MRLSPLVGCVILCFGCSEQGTLTTPDNSDTTDSTWIPDAGPWTRCAWVPGEDTDLAECTTVALPLDYADPSGPTLEVLVKRLAAEGTPAGQYWFLHGGPGASAIDDLADLSWGLQADFPDFAFYAVDHRGIGGSGQLTCPTEEGAGSDGGTVVTLAEWPACLVHLDDQWGEDLAHLNTTNSARDIGTLIDLFAAENEQIFVYGGSYGTYLAQRYLHLFPDQPAGVILDGIMPATRTFVGYDRLMNDTAHDLFDVCGDDPDCASHFGGDPWQIATDAIHDLDAGHCASLGSNTTDIRTVFGYFSVYWPIRDYLPALAHRLDRCSPEDVAAIATFVNAILGTGNRSANDGDGRSEVLGKYIAMSELWDPGAAPSPAEAQADLDGYTMALGVEVEMASLQGTWPTFELDAYHDAFPTYDGPLLMLQGGLDPATVTSAAVELEAEYAGDAQTWAYFPYGAHGLVSSTITDTGEYCGYELLKSFMLEPDSALDLSCIDAVLPPDFNGDALTTQVLFGTTNTWGD